LGKENGTRRGRRIATQRRLGVRSFVVASSVERDEKKYGASKNIGRHGGKRREIDNGGRITKVALHVG